MKPKSILALIGLVVFLAHGALGASVRDDAAERLQKSADVLKEIAAAPDKGIPDEVVQHAKCIVVIPHLVKAGLVVGGKYGHGVAVCRVEGGTGKRAGAKAGWSAPAFVTIGGGTWGPQIGAEGIDLVMMVMNDKGLQSLLSNKIQFSLEGSAAAGPVGRHASVGADWKMDAEVLSYSRSQGAFAGQMLEGAVIEQDSDATKAVYGGGEISFDKILLGKIPAPAAAGPFLRAVNEISHDAAAKEARQQMPGSQNKMDNQNTPKN
jgi:lipid-binding SYLF domain-containing protein